MVIGCGVLLVDVMWFYIGRFDVKIFHVTVQHVLLLSSCMACVFFSFTVINLLLLFIHLCSGMH